MKRISYLLLLLSFLLSSPMVKAQYIIDIEGIESNNMVIHTSSIFPIRYDVSEFDFVDSLSQIDSVSLKRVDEKDYEIVNNIGIEYASFPQATISLSDGRISTSGFYYDTDVNQWDAYNYFLLLKDKKGKAIWTKKLGIGGGLDLAYDHVITKDMGYVIAGWSDTKESPDFDNQGAGGPDILVVKLDSLGTKEWDLFYGTSEHETARCVSSCADGGYVVGGEQIVKEWDDYVVQSLILKISSDGRVLWESVIDGHFSGSIHGIAESSNREILLVGLVELNENIGIKGYQGSGDMIVAKLDSTGSLIWKKLYGTPVIDRPISIHSIGSGMVVLAESLTLEDGVSERVCLLLDANGSLVKEIIIAESE